MLWFYMEREIRPLLRLFLDSFPSRSFGREEYVAREARYCDRRARFVVIKCPDILNANSLAIFSYLRIAEPRCRKKCRIVRTMHPSIHIPMPDRRAKVISAWCATRRAHSDTHPSIRSTSSSSISVSHASTVTAPDPLRYATPFCHSIHSTK